ncbi:hypothetical protein Hanom_Chr03g00200241 [Helianthus anomalus]
MLNSGLHAAYGPIGLVIIRQFHARCYVCEQFNFLVIMCWSSWLYTLLCKAQMFVLSLCPLFVRMYEVIVNRLLCFDDPAVHLVLSSLGGLQCLFYLVYDAFVYRWV